MQMEWSEEKFFKGIVGEKNKATLFKQALKDRTFIHTAVALQ